MFLFKGKVCFINSPMASIEERGSERVQKGKGLWATADLFKFIRYTCTLFQEKNILELSK